MMFLILLVEELEGCLWTLKFQEEAEQTRLVADYFSLKKELQ
jgi:hypothetical protein